MACKRSAVRSRLAPPAFAGFASFVSASPLVAEAAASYPEGRRRAGLSFQFPVAAPFSDEDAPLMTYVYILESLDSAHFYVGVTSDLRARLAKHNAGAVPHTSKYRPWRLKTYVAFSDEARAIAFEKYLKSGSGRAFAKKHL